MNRTNNDCRKSTFDCGPNPYVTDLSKAAQNNENYRTALWTGTHLQLTVMCIPIKGEIGLEVHPDTDQFLCIVSGEGTACMGSCKRQLSKQCNVSAGDAVFVPAGTWHNICNSGTCPLKIYTIYAPTHHPHGTVEPTRETADKKYLF